VGLTLDWRTDCFAGATSDTVDVDSGFVVSSGEVDACLGSPEVEELDKCEVMDPLDEGKPAIEMGRFRAAPMDDGGELAGDKISFFKPVSDVGDA